MTWYIILSVAIAALMLAVTAARSRSRKNRRRRIVRRAGAVARTPGDERREEEEIRTYWQGVTPKVDAWPPLEGEAAGSGEQVAPDGALILGAEAAAAEALEVATAPRVMPATAGCKLGAHFLRGLLDQQWRLPDSEGAYKEAEHRRALDRLEAEDADASLPHGGVVCRLSAQSAVVFEPLLCPATDVEGVIEAVARAVGEARVSVVLGQLPEEAGGEGLGGHIGALVQALEVPPTRLFSLQDDGGYYSHVEEQACYVPCLIDAAYVPERFVAQMLEHSMGRYEAGEPEASLRVLGPLAEALWERAQVGAFSPVLGAQILNVLGVANRDVGAIDESIHCLRCAVELLRVEGEPEDLQVVHKNLGEVLLRFGAQDSERLKAAANHLRHAAQLAGSDVESLESLGRVYVARYQLQGKRSMLERALHAYRQALRQAPGDGPSLQGLEEAEVLLQRCDQVRRSQQLAQLPPSAPLRRVTQSAASVGPTHACPTWGGRERRPKLSVLESPSPRAQTPAPPRAVMADDAMEIEVRKVANHGGQLGS